MTLKGETVATGAPTWCDECKSIMPPKVQRSAAGHYIGLSCDCGPYSRESGYFADFESAQKALKKGEYHRP